MLMSTIHHSICFLAISVSILTLVLLCSFYLRSMANKMANAVVTTGAIEGIFSPKTFAKKKSTMEMETGEKGLHIVGAGVEAGVGVAPFHPLATSEKTPLTLIPEDESPNPTIPLVDSNNDNTLGGGSGSGGGGGLSVSTKSTRDQKDLYTSTKR